MQESRLPQRHLIAAFTAELGIPSVNVLHLLLVDGQTQLKVLNISLEGTVAPILLP